MSYHSHSDFRGGGDLLFNTPRPAQCRVDDVILRCHRDYVHREHSWISVVNSDTAHQRHRNKSDWPSGVVRSSRHPFGFLCSGINLPDVTPTPTLTIPRMIRVHSRMVRDCHLNTFPSRVGVRAVLALLVESGVLYCIVWVGTNLYVSPMNTSDLTSVPRNIDSRLWWSRSKWRFASDSPTHRQPQALPRRGRTSTSARTW